MIQRHEVNILNNTIDQAKAIGSERLMKLAGDAKFEIEKEIARATGKAQGPALAATLPHTSGAPVSPLASAPVVNDDTEPTDPNAEEAMTVEEMRATGLYDEKTIEALCKEYRVEYVPPVTAEESSDAPQATEDNPVEEAA